MLTEKISQPLSLKLQTTIHVYHRDETETTRHSATARPHNPANRHFSETWTLPSLE